MSLKNEKKSVAGIVLAGGLSSRMGRNKAFLKLNSLTVIEQTLERLGKVAQEIIIATNNPEEYSFLGLRVVRDALPHQGPLGGILAGLKASAHPINLVVACDMPFLKPELLEFMLGFTDKFDVVVPKSKRGIEPLHAVYSTMCSDPIAESLRSGDWQVVSFFPKVRVKYLQVEMLEKYDPEGLSMFNINNWQDFERAKRLYLQEKMRKE